VDFRPLHDIEQWQLLNALRGNTESDRAILMDHCATSFIYIVDPENWTTR
jgi:hypothetical protein